MAVATAPNKKPKRIAPVNEAQQPKEQHQTLQADPVLRDLLQTARPESTPLPAHIKQKQIEEGERRKRQAQFDSDQNGKNGTWVFVKNQSPREEIVFKDGTKLRFTESLFTCRDKELAEKILAVAEVYNIVLK